MITLKFKIISIKKHEWRFAWARQSQCFELGPYYNIKSKYPIQSVHPTQCLSLDPTTKQLQFNINADYFDFETNSKKL